MHPSVRIYLQYTIVCVYRTEVSKCASVSADGFVQIARIDVLDAVNDRCRIAFRNRTTSDGILVLTDQNIYV